jgi:hypothetical protein
MFLFDSKEATGLASAASPRAMGFRPKWQPCLRRHLPVTTKSDRRTSLPLSGGARTAEARGNKRVRPGFSLTCRELTPCPSQTTTFPNPNRRPLGRRFYLPISPTIPQNPSSELQPPPSPAATADKFAGTELRKRDAYLD